MERTPTASEETFFSALQVVLEYEVPSTGQFDPVCLSEILEAEADCGEWTADALLNGTKETKSTS